MITYTNQRIQGNYALEPVSRLMTPNEALNALILVDLAWGATVGFLSETRVLVSSCIFGTVDRDVFEGSAREMEFLVQVAAHYALFTGGERGKKVLVDSAMKELGQLRKEWRRKPLHVEMFAPLAIGRMASVYAILAAAGIADKATAETLAKIRLEDLIPLMMLSQETGVTPTEVANELGLIAA